jgi:hypothetical protein
MKYQLVLVLVLCVLGLVMARSRSFLDDFTDDESMPLEQENYKRIGIRSK